jgi:hypothetical protein
MFLCMRTSIDIDDGLLRRAKELAAQTDRTLRNVIEDALRESFGRAARQENSEPVRLAVSSQPLGLCPGVDLDDSAALRELMEQPDAPS